MKDPQKLSFVQTWTHLDVMQKQKGNFQIKLLLMAVSVAYSFQSIMPWSKLLEKVPATVWKKSKLLKKCSDLLKKYHIFLPKHQP